MTNRIYEVRAQWDDEAKVWLAESDDVPGLVAEADSIPDLIDKLRILIPELLEANGVVPESNEDEFDLRFVSVAHFHFNAARRLACSAPLRSTWCLAQNDNRGHSRLRLSMGQHH